MQNRRASLRHRAFKGAQIVSNDGASAVDCTVRDVSDTGARLRVESPIGVPAAFILRLAAGGLERDCRLVWTNAKEIGAAFVP